MQGVMDGTLCTHAIYHKRNNVHVKMTLEEIEGEHEENYFQDIASGVLPQ
jgi:hypothetical protein